FNIVLCSLSSVIVSVINYLIGHQYGNTIWDLDGAKLPVELINTIVKVANQLVLGSKDSLTHFDGKVDVICIIVGSHGIEYLKMIKTKDIASRHSHSLSAPYRFRVSKKALQRVFLVSEIWGSLTSYLSRGLHKY